MNRPRLAPLIIVMLAAALTAGCASMATGRIAHGLGQAILNQDDPETVRAGAPAFLLLLDGLVEESPYDRRLLSAAARLYGAYAALFVEEAARSRRMSRRGVEYARRAFRAGLPALEDLERIPFDGLEKALGEVTEEEQPLLYGYAAAWAGAIQNSGGDWKAIAQLPRVAAMMRRAAELDEGHDGGRAHLYLAVMNSLLPPAMGGRPEVGRDHFERALALSGGRDLMVKVEFARRYARLTFDRALHDRLLREVLDADPRVPGLTLSNTLAQREAAKLLEESADYFPE